MKPRHHLRAVCSLLLIAVLLAACVGQQATPTVVPVPPTATPVPPTVAPPTPAAPAATAAAEPQPYQPRPDAPPYALRGPYAVGVRDFVIDTPQRQVPVTVWYPASNPEKLPEVITYELDFPTNAQPSVTIAGQALADAAPDLSGGPYPLLVHSHAGWTFRQDMVYLMEHLASQGFVVMAAGNEDNWGTLGESFYRSEISRPRDVSNEIDFAEELTAAGGELAGLIDTEHIAVSGWSLGGQTALEKAGARLNLVEQQKNYCVAWPSDGRCAFYTTPIEEMATLAGLDALPAGDWPDWSEPRVDVIVLFEPSEGSLGALPVEVKTPVLLIEGTADVPGYGWDGIASPEKTAVILDNAGHVVFFNSCPAMPGMVEGDFFGVCSDPVWDVNRIHDLTNHFVTAFLKAELKDDAEAAKALAPENVSFPGVTYKTTAYGAPTAPAEPEAPHGLRPDAPEYAKRGPFPVGYKSVVIGEGTERPLKASLWYPALNPTGLPEEVTYSVTPKIPVEPAGGPFVVYGHALQDAAVDAAAAPYPLVVFSHGFSINAPWYNALIENYASHGFIVLAPEHVEKFDTEWSEIANASIDRPRDIKQTLDYAEQINAPAGDLAGLIDMENVAVVGHSYGGYTALAAAGAQYDLDAFNARCAQLPADDPLTFLCAPVVPKEAEMAARAGLDPMPEGLWPSFGDPRVKAIVPMAGDSYLFDKAGLSKITIPMLAIGGTADTATPYDWGSRPSYDNASSAKKALVTLEGAEHVVSMVSCDNMPWVKETDFYQWICFDPVWDKDRGLDLINHFSTAFLLDTLKGDTKAAEALAPENVSFPGIKYEATGYGATP